MAPTIIETKDTTEVSTVTEVEPKQLPVWLDKATAAARLGVVPRRILQLVNERKIKYKIKRKPGSASTKLLIDAASVDAYLELRRAQKAVVETSPPPEEPAPALDAVIKKSSGDWIGIQAKSMATGSGKTEIFQTVMEALASAIASQRPAMPVWLTLKQAAEYSGLTQGYLLKAVKDCSLAHIDLGPVRGGRYRIKRADLDAM